jgi:hypothetical protein
MHIPAPLNMTHWSRGNLTARIEGDVLICSLLRD